MESSLHTPLSTQSKHLGRNQFFFLNNSDCILFRYHSPADYFLLALEIIVIAYFFGEFVIQETSEVSFLYFWMTLY